MDDPSTPSNPNGNTSNPNDADSDNDGLNDGDEGTNMTDPNSADTDNDGLTDNEEVTGTDDPSTGAVPSGTSNPTSNCDPIGLVTTDTDNDGLTDCEETTGINDPSTPSNPNGNTSNPNDADSDDDGLNDGDEGTNMTDPNSADTDNDGLTDNEEVTGTDDPSTSINPGGTTTNPTSSDTDSDGLDDGEEISGVDNPATGAVPSGTSNPNSNCDPNPTGPTCGDNTACVNLTTFVWLQGTYDNGNMTTKLNDLGYLPGQDPTTFFGNETPAGQPYNTAPWNYSGTEGATMNYATVGNSKAGYASTVVDWVLVSLRSAEDRTTTVCTKAALVHSDGQVEFLSGDDCCTIDTTQSYYVVIEHRSHLVVMSHEKVPVSGGTISYDFRSQESYKGLFGFGQKQLLPGVYAMYAGNGDQVNGNNGNRVLNIITSDKDIWLNQNGNHSSYYINDFDLNGDVNVQDKNIWLQNNGVFSDVKWEN